MRPKNTICLWFDKDAHQAARFYAGTFPDTEVTAVPAQNLNCSVCNNGASKDDEYCGR